MEIFQQIQKCISNSKDHKIKGITAFLCLGYFPSNFVKYHLKKKEQKKVFFKSEHGHHFIVNKARCTIAVPFISPEPNHIM